MGALAKSTKATGKVVPISKKAEVTARKRTNKLSGLMTIIGATLTRIEEHQAKGQELVSKLKVYMTRLDDAQ